MKFRTGVKTNWIHLALLLTAVLIFIPGVEKVFAAESKERYERGLRALRMLNPEGAENVMKGLQDIAPEMADFILEFSYADVFSRGVLSLRETELVAIAGMCAAGTQRPQLIVHIKSGLNVGLTKEQIIEIMDQMAVYAGFPAALNGISAAREAFTQIAKQE